MNIAICLELSFDTIGAYKYLGSQNRQFREALFCLAKEVTRQTGRELAFVRIDDLQSDGSFKDYYILSGAPTDCLRFKPSHKQFMPDVVINRKKDELYHHPYFAHIPWAAYNAKEIANLGNKSVALQKFPQYIPRSFCVEGNGDAEIEKARRILTQNPAIAQWVMKPLRQNGGRGIELLDRNEVIDTIVKHNIPVVLQEFYETRSVPELHITGRHDVRVYVIDGEPLLLAIRQPKEGGFLANTAAGGSVRFADKKALPEAARRIVDKIIADVRAINKRYFISIDLFYTDDGWKLIELNDQPGLPAIYQTPFAAVISEKLVNSLKGVYSDAL